MVPKIKKFSELNKAKSTINKTTMCDDWSAKYAISYVL